MSQNRTAVKMESDSIELGTLPPPPKHIAIVMDGNGRWAEGRGLPRLEGHRQGAQTLEHIIEASADLGIEYLTVYAFSSENWERPQLEVDGLINLMRFYLRNKVIQFHENGVRLNVIGNYQAFPDDVVSMIQEALDLTKNNTRITLNVALNYGGRAEILQATQKIAKRVAAGDLEADSLTEQIFSHFLWTAGCPDPDVFIRTSGEYRISNYLLWQLSYTELVFIEKNWPDFTKKDLMDVIKQFQGRQRRFGAL